MSALLAAASLPTVVLVFAAGAGAVVLLGIRLSARADRLADLTGLGEAVTGAVFLGASTSLAGITGSVVAALAGRPELALSNAFGGIAVQTAFLALADVSYRRANLEHAAASIDNLMQAALLISILGLIMVAMVGPDVSVAGVHPLTPILLVAYVAGQRLVRRSRGKATWRPVVTSETRRDVPDEPPQGGRVLGSVVARFLVLAVLVVAAGWTLTQAAQEIADRTVLSDSMVGALLLAVATSLPELVTTLAAVRRGALTLAVGGIIGGNAFDSLFAAAADVAYRPGSIYHAVSPDAAGGSGALQLVAISLLMTAVLLLGLLRRERRGVASIGFESGIVLVLYAVAVTMLGLGG